ncbi:MAG: hypothetical protein HWQ37_05265 [Nostoc sp. NMS4]|nr:hypothetical protein [Nostoc sp. NMS4]
MATLRFHESVNNCDRFGVHPSLHQQRMLTFPVSLEKLADSPQLNLIEILWRFMKYECIEIDVYSS